MVAEAGSPGVKRLREEVEAEVERCGGCSVPDFEFDEILGVHLV